MDIWPNISWTISPCHKLDAKVHFFSLANSVQIENLIINDKNLGYEFDSRYSYTLNEEFNINLGFSYYLPTETFKIIKTGNGSNIKQPYWVWAMLTYSPAIFNN